MCVLICVVYNLVFAFCIVGFEYVKIDNVNLSLRLADYAIKVTVTTHIALDKVVAIFDVIGIFA